MTYYEIIKKYGEGKGTDAMWRATKRISEHLEELKEHHPEKYWALVKGTYHDMCGGHFNEEFGRWQIEQMSFTDKQGAEHHAPRWTVAQYEATYNANRSKLPASYTLWDWAVVLEMMYTDNYCLYKGWWPEASEADLDGKFIAAAVNWLNDKDNPYGDEKAWGYLVKE